MFGDCIPSSLLLVDRRSYPSKSPFILKDDVSNEDSVGLMIDRVSGKKQ